MLDLWYTDDMAFYGGSRHDFSCTHALLQSQHDRHALF